MHFLKKFSFCAAVLAGVASAQNNFTVNTPGSLIQCQPTLFQWTGGSPPYFPRITAAGDAATLIESFDETTSTSLSWTVDLSVGTAITVVIVDSTGASAASGISPAIVAGSSSSCVDDDNSNTIPGMTTATSTPSSTSRTTSNASAPSSSAPPSSTTNPSNTDGASSVKGSIAGAFAAAVLTVAALF